MAKILGIPESWFLLIVYNRLKRCMWRNCTNLFPFSISKSVEHVIILVLSFQRDYGEIDKYLVLVFLACFWFFLFVCLESELSFSINSLSLGLQFSGAGKTGVAPCHRWLRWGLGKPG